MEDNEIKMRVYKTFGDYYSDPEYRRNHLAYMSVKVECLVCKTMVARCNMTKHKRTLKHQRIQQVIDERVPKDDIDASKIKELFDDAVKRYLENKKYLPIKQLKA